MRTIEEIRLENFRALVTELLGEGAGDPDIANTLGISKVYAWQLRTGKRTAIDGKAARKMEMKAEKPMGWMDTDFKLWPFPGIEPQRFAGLSSNQRIEIQGHVRVWVERFESENAELARKRANGSRS